MYVMNGLVNHVPNVKDFEFGQKDWPGFHCVLKFDYRNFKADA